MFKLLFLFLVIQKCLGNVQDLDEDEYEKMPPLFGIDSNYDSCLREPGGMYCLAKFDLDGDENNELIKMIREYSQNDLKNYNHSYIDRAVCVTKTCKKYIQDETVLSKPAGLKKTLEGCLNDTIWTKYGLEAKLSQIHYCDTHSDQVSIDYTDWIFLAFVISILGMNLIGSTYDICKKRNKENTSEIDNSYLLSFSISRNWNQLTNLHVDPQYESLKGIHGLKSISTFFVNVAHVMWLVGNGFTDNPREFELAHDRFHYQVIFGGMVIVQIFFVISGCLFAFHLQLTSEKKPLTWNMIPKILFFRWVRLTPAYAFVVLFSATWLRHLGSGPLWNKFVLSVSSACREHWWKHLLYFNNYVIEDKLCAIHTWHVSSDMQLFTAGLIVTMVSSSRRYLALAMFGVMGMVAPALHVWLQDLDPLPLHRPEFYRDFGSDTLFFLHIRGHNNFSCYAIGMIVGLVSYYCVKNKMKYSNNQFLKFLIWCIPLGIVGIFWISGFLFYFPDRRPNVLIKMGFAAIQRPAIGLMIALLILNLVYKFENGIRSVLEWRIWVFTSRLSYTIYLLHLNLVYVLLGSRTQLAHVSFFYVIINHFGVVSLTFAMSIPFYLMLEAPIRSLLKICAEKLAQDEEKKIK